VRPPLGVGVRPVALGDRQGYGGVGTPGKIRGMQASEATQALRAAQLLGVDAATATAWTHTVTPAGIRERVTDYGYGPASIRLYGDGTVTAVVWMPIGAEADGCVLTAAGWA
jgi:hypothetical protein